MNFFSNFNFSSFFLLFSFVPNFYWLLFWRKKNCHSQFRTLCLMVFCLCAVEEKKRERMRTIPETDKDISALYHTYPGRLLPEHLNPHKVKRTAKPTKYGYGFCFRRPSPVYNHRIYTTILVNHCFWLAVVARFRASLPARAMVSWIGLQYLPTNWCTARSRPLIFPFPSYHGMSRIQK